MSMRFESPRVRGRGGRRSGHLESLERREVPSALPLVADPAITNTAYVEAVYQDVLGRQADPTGLQWGTSLVDSGQPRASFAVPLIFSDEANSQFIRSAYQQYLGRETDLTGLTYWLAQMQAGTKNQAIEAAFLSSDEFYARAGGTTDGWIQAAYQTVLGRAAEAEALSWATSELNAGKSRYDLAMALVMSMEGETRSVEGELTRLGMSLNAAIASALAAELSAGQVTEQQVTADFLTTPEYFEAHTGVPDTIVPVPNWLPTAPKTEADISAQAAGGNANVVFIGDSITQLWQSTGSSDWNQYFAPLRSLDAGVAGDSTENLLWRLEQGNLNGISPKLAVVMVGVNDVGKGDSAGDVVTGITSVVRTVQNEFPNAKILLLGVLPALQVPANSAVRQEIDQINQAIAPLADGQRIWFLDVSAQLLNPDGSLNQSLFQAGNIHPNAQGYHLLAQAIAPSVQALS
ncbi:MAG TPA: GDSL-type esterase/lipase family protein [Pirellulales bacterium]|nr:GDSL-type esterase/lipase family protein [Pirellulales bacterium]